MRTKPFADPTRFLMVNPVRYRPGEALRWLEMGADGLREQAQKQSKSVVQRSGARTLGKDLREAAGALADLGRSALADLKSRQAQANEYLLHEESFDVVEGGKVRTVRYSEVLAIKLDDHTATLILERGSLTIKPFAYIVSGPIKVPIGWSRNEIEVPFELLLDELAARTKVRIDETA